MTKEGIEARNDLESSSSGLTGRSSNHRRRRPIRKPRRLLDAPDEVGHDNGVRRGQVARMERSEIRGQPARRSRVAPRFTRATGTLRMRLQP